MIFTTRFLYLLGLGLLLVVLGGLVPNLLPLALVYDGALLLLAGYDFFVTIPRTGIEVDRQCGHILSLGVRENVTVRLRNLSSRSLRMTVKDSPPPLFQQEGRKARASLPRAGLAQYTYSVRSLMRGEFSFGDVFLRLDGTLGLVRRQMRLVSPLTVRVYPNVKQLSQVELALTHASMVQQGLRPSRLLGEGTEFESLREYSPDDDYRWIDWKATAKTNRLVSRQYEAQRNQRLLIAIDAGRLMGVKVGDFTKLDYATNVAVLLAQVALNKGDLVGVLLFANRLLAYLPPDKGREHLGRIVQALYPVQSVRLESDYALAFAHLARKNTRRSLVACFTDVVDAEASRSLISGMMYLVPRHLPLCITISDSDLIAAQRAVPPATAQAFELVAAMELWEDYRSALRLLERQGALTVNVPANMLTTATINRYVEIKRRGLL